MALTKLQGQLLDTTTSLTADTIVSNNIIIDSNLIITDSTNNRVSISNTVPSVTLTVGGAVRVANLESQPIESVPGTFTNYNIGSLVRNENPLSSTPAIYVGTFNQPYIYTTSGTGFGVGTYNAPRVYSNSSSTIFATYNLIDRGGNNPLDTATGGNIYGTYNLIRHLYNPSANTSIVTGNINNTFNNQSIAIGSVTNSYLNYNSILLGTSAAASANVTNFYGSYLAATVGSAAGANTSTITNYYAAYYGTPVVAASGRITNRYAIYSTDPSSPSYFAGSVGIGTASPSYTLTVNGGNGNAIVYTGTANTAALGCTGAIPYVGSLSNSSFLLLTNATVQAVLDTTGNFGLGATPSAWASATALQVQNTAIEGRVSNPSYGTFSTNAFSQAGVWKYISSDYASRYTQYQANHYWFGAGSGTANNTITDFATAKMILDSSGNLGIGTTTPVTKLGVSWGTTGINNGTSALTDVSGLSSTYTYIHNQDSAGTGNQVGFVFCHAGAPGIPSGIVSRKNSGTWETNLDFYTNSITGGSVSAWQRKMTLDASGNLSVTGNLTVTGKLNTITSSGSLPPSGSLILNLESLFGVYTSGLLLIRGNENGINQTIRLYTWNLSMYASTSTRYVRIKEIMNNIISNDYGNVYAYLSSYSATYTTLDQNGNGTTSSVSDIYFRNGVGAACVYSYTIWRTG